MRIAFFVGKFPVLSETFVVNQAVGLKNRGHTVHIFPLDLEKPDISLIHSDIKRHDLLKHVIYLPKISENKFLTAWRFIILLLKYGYKDIRYTLSILNFRQYGKRKRMIRGAFEKLPFVKEERYDIVHCQFGFFGLKFLQQYRHLPVFRNSKLVVSFRGFDISRFVHQSGKTVYDDLFKQGDLFLPNCEFFKKRLLELGCDNKKIAVHRSGVDISRFVFRERDYVQSSRIRIITVGRLIEKKGIEYGIKAIDLLIKRGRDVEFDIIGEGPLKDKLTKLINQLKLNKRVRLHGKMTQSQIIKQLNRAQLFIATSVTSSDGNQDSAVNTLKEAMLVGLPVIGTLHGGIPELIEDGVCGFLVPERDVHALVEKIEYLADHPQIWPRLTQAGRKKVERDCDMSKLNDELLKLYQLYPGIINKKNNPHASTHVA